MGVIEMFVNCTCSGLNDFCCRLTALLQEISCEQEAKTIVFVETKRKVEDIARNIRRCG
jgi:superfamily II DNA/RNA helicase